ncbi:MAG: hypothetical protein ACRCZZ_01960 [Phocaeicola sp.]
MYKDFIHFFVLSCKKATYLLEKKNHTHLNLWELLQLKLHLSICSYCAGYEKESQLIDEAIRRVAKAQAENENSHFSKAEIEEIKKRIAKEVKEQNQKLPQ